MKYIVETKKSVAQAVTDIEAACKDHQIGVLHVHDLQQTTKNKGVDFPNACQIMEICNPQKANAVLTAEMEMNLALPSRISVYSQDGQTKIGMIQPKAMLSVLSDSKELLQVAQEVEEITMAIIDQAKQSFLRGLTLDGGRGEQRRACYNWPGTPARKARQEWVGAYAAASSSRAIMTATESPIRAALPGKRESRPSP